MTRVLWRGWARAVDGVAQKSYHGGPMTYSGEVLPQHYRDGWERVVLLPEDALHTLTSAAARRMGHARAKKLSPARRRAIARRAAQARWNKKRRTARG